MHKRSVAFRQARDDLGPLSTDDAELHAPAARSVVLDDVDGAAFRAVDHRRERDRESPCLLSEDRHVGFLVDREARGPLVKRHVDLQLARDRIRLEGDSRDVTARFHT
jgi:hypothetical protein